MVQSLRKTVCHCLKMLNAESPHNPEIPFPVMCPREMKMHLYTKTCMWVLTAVLFLIAKKWKPNAHRLRKGYKSFFLWMAEPYSGLSFSNKRKWSIPVHTVTWMNLENVRIERSRLQKTTVCVIPVMNAQNTQIHRPRKAVW